jgi:hypothetical protein
MDKSDIKRLMIVHNDNDFIRAWDWLGKVTLSTLVETNYCGESLLNNSRDIETFIKSLIPTAIEFASYRCEDSNSLARGFKRYRDISPMELDSLIPHLSKAKFYFNFEDSHLDYEFGGAETLIIDLENKTSYIR